MGGRTNPDGSIAVSSWDHNEADSLGNAILTKPNPLAGYERLASAVRAAGITRVDGEVIGSLPIGFKPPLTGTGTLVQTVRITQPSNYARTVFVEALRKAGARIPASYSSA